ncbi:MAG: putative collagen-binding domain-containing protein, partial [Chthoniobacteraceae bacterium]
IYTPNGKPFALDLTSLSAPKLRTWWWDPRTGIAAAAGDLERATRVEVTPPRSGVSMDWVLVLDDPAQKFPDPGTVPQAR